MRFVIRRNKQGFFWWRAVGNNNKVLAASELMDSKESCLNGIAVVVAGAASAPIEDKTHEAVERESV